MQEVGVSGGIVDDTPQIWGRGYSTDSATVRGAYDTFADSGAYDETFDEWGYVGPQTAAAILRNYVPPGSRMLDAACGSGLTGTALHDLGYRHLVGIDISPKLLAEATGAYERLEVVDMQGTEPMPYLPNHPKYGTQIQVQYFVYQVR